jgi:hypothetical protein
MRNLAPLVLAAVAVLTLAEAARADTLVIRRPGSHPDYVFEAEPHLLLGFIDPNNSVGIGFGLDWMLYPGASKRCRGGSGPCVLEDRDVSYFWFPLVMQWNFWLSRDWSVFGEPGVAFRMVSPGDDKFQPFVFYAGGRYHFADRISLTMRVGYPSFSVGVSFFF